MALHKIAALVGLTSLLMLVLPAAAQDVTVTPDERSSADFFHLNRVHGDGYSLLVPSNATVGVGTHGIAIRGPEVDIVDGDGNSYDDASYFLSIRVYDNPDHLSAEAYATHAAQTLWDKATAENAPTGGLPKLVDGQIAPDYAAHLTMAGEPAFAVTYNDYFALDRRIYLAHGDQILFINYQDTSDNEAPLGQVQLDVYALLLATLQLDD